MATQLFFADSVNSTQNENFKSARKFWDLKHGWLNVKTYRIFLLFWQVIFRFVAQLIFPFARFIKHSVYLMHKLIVSHQLCYGCQILLNAQIRVIAEIIKSPNVYSNKLQRNNSILLPRLVSIAKMSSLLSKIIKISNIAMQWALIIKHWIKSDLQFFWFHKTLFCFYVCR